MLSNDKGIQAVVNKHCFHFNEGENWLPSFPEEFWSISIYYSQHQILMPFKDTCSLRIIVPSRAMDILLLLYNGNFYP